MHVSLCVMCLRETHRNFVTMVVSGGEAWGMVYENENYLSFHTDLEPSMDCSYFYHIKNTIQNNS